MNQAKRCFQQGEGLGFGAFVSKGHAQGRLGNDENFCFQCNPEPEL